MLRWLRFYRSTSFGFALVVACALLGFGLVTAYCAGSTFEPVLGISELPAIATFLGFCGALVLLWRFTHTAGAATVIIILSALTPGAAPAVWSMLFILGMRHPMPRSFFALGAALGALGLQVAIYESMNLGPRRGGDLIAFAVLGAVMLLGSGITGYVVGLHRQRALTTTRLLAAALEREDAIIAQTRATERLQLAEEIHDVLSRHLGRLTLHANALQHAPLTPQEIKDSIDTIALSAQSAAEELRRVLDILDDARQGSAAEDYADGLTEIFLELSEKGVTITPPAPPSIGDFTPVDQRTIERFFREALGNVLQHAATPTASITLLTTPVDTRWTVASSTRESERSPAFSGSTPRFGILKLQQRARLRHGDILTRVSANAFEIELVIPHIDSY